MNTKILFLIAILVLLITACSKKLPDEPKVVDEKSVEEVGSSLDIDVTDVDKLSDELSVDELEGLDSDLAEIENSDI